MTAKLQAIKNGDLYALLSVCTDEDLAPLVETITSRPTNFLDTNEDYKKHKPKHSMYHKAIGDDLRLFGGNSLRNIFRGEGPSYDEIVVDVCKKLDVSCSDGKTAENEQNLLTLHLERQWKLLSKEEQDEMIAKAREEAAGQIWTSTSILKDGVLFLGTRMLWGPLGWGSLVYSVAEPAFKVTVPCVLHIAYLRRKYLEQATKPKAVTPAPKPSHSSSYSGGHAPVPAPVVESAGALVFSAPDGQPVLSLAKISDAPSQGWYPVADSESGISRLNPLLHAVPNLAVAHNVATTNYMEVVVTKGKLVQAADGNGFRAIVHGPDKSIIENARLYEANGLSNLVNAAVLFQIVSIAVAQKHLADISQKLSEIKAGVDRIQLFQKNERKSILTGATRYFEQVAPSVLDGEFSDGIRNQIEQHEASLLQVQDHLMEDIRHESRQMLTVQGSDSFGSKGLHDNIRSHQDLLTDLYRQLLLCIRARACGWQLLTVFPGETRLKENRKRSIEEALSLLAESGNMLKQTDMFVRQKVRELSSFWNSSATINERKLSLLSWNDILISEIGSCKEQIIGDIQAAEAFVAGLREPVKMIVRIENKRITAACTV